MATSLVLSCGGSKAPSTPDDAAVDAAIEALPFLVIGPSALQLHLETDQGIDASTSLEALNITMLLSADTFPKGDGTGIVHGVWSPCGVDLPNAMTVPYAHALEETSTESSNGTLSGKGAGANYVQGPVAFPIGACLADPISDPLPDASAICPASNDPTVSPCFGGVVGACAFGTNDPTGARMPGIPIAAHGLSPDADILYIVGRVTFALEGTPMLDGSILGTTTQAALEWHVLGCHLRSGTICNASQVQALEASRPTIAVKSGTLRDRSVPQYFTCPQFLSDVEGALDGSEGLDGGAPYDAGSGLTTDGGATALVLSFAHVQHDLDALGCATCHDHLPGPLAMRLIYQPESQEEVRRNYEAVLPWIGLGSHDPSDKAGGRFVNQVPLPGAIRDRWLRWIAIGAPYN